MLRECKNWPLRAHKEVRLLRAPTLAAAEGRLAAPVPVEVPAAAPVKGNLREQKTAAGNVLLLLLLLLLLLRLRLPIRGFRSGGWQLDRSSRKGRL